MEVITLTNNNLTDRLMTDFVELYISIWSSPPYNEHFQYNDVYHDLFKYINNGYVLLTMDKLKVIGFLAASFDSSFSKQVDTNLNYQGINSQKDVYLSELGVHHDYRCKGLATIMMDKFLNCYNDKIIYLRTAKHNNDKIINYYKRFLFEPLNIIDEVANMRTDGTIHIDKRIFMVKHPATKRIHGE